MEIANAKLQITKMTPECLGELFGVGPLAFGVSTK
jgi:hypothetical protein